MSSMSSMNPAKSLIYAVFGAMCYSDILNATTIAARTSKLHSFIAHGSTKRNRKREAYPEYQSKHKSR